MKITKAKGEGQGQCLRCKQLGIWNVQWMCFLYKIEGMPGVYCKKCADRIKWEEYVEGRERFRLENLEWECTNPNL